MRTLTGVFFAFFSFTLFPFPVSADAAARTRVLVAPFRNAGAVRGQDYLQLALPAVLAERLEGVPSYDVADGPLVLTADSAKLAPARGKKGAAAFDLAAANALAESLGAAFFITGSYAGSEWDWSLTVEAYAVQPDGPRLAGSKTVRGDLTKPIRKRNGRIVRIVDIAVIHVLLADAVSGAFAKAKLPAPGAVKIALIQPSTKDSWAFVQLGLAYVRLFAPPDPRHHRPAVEIAEYAVRVDPDYPEAQRLYAVLLEGQVGKKPGAALKARIHYEAALKLRPNDTRTLIRLGRIELGAGNEDAAREYLSKAAAARPNDPEPHFWLAKADLKIGDDDASIGEFEKVRSLSPTRLDARRELVGLYCRRHRYADAADELRAIVKADPADLGAAFALAAVLRADKRNEEAAEAYDAAAERFPKEPRFARFRESLGNGESGLFSLVSVIASGKRAAAGQARDRETFHRAANDAARDFIQHGKDACQDGRGASSVLLALEYSRRHADRLKTLRESAAAVKAAIAHGDDAALAPNERADADALTHSLETAERDGREMRAQMALTVLPLLKKNGCEVNDESVRAATVEEIARRDGDWRIVLPEVEPTPNVPIAPEVPADPAKVIRFRVNNEAGTEDYLLILDGEAVGTIAAGSNMVFTARIGTHSLCLVPKNDDCSKPGAVRTVFLYEGFTWDVKPGRST